MLLFSFFLGVIFPSQINSQRKKSKDKTQEVIATPQKKKSPSYSDFVTKNTKSDRGLFTVHENKEAYLYEIPKSYFGKDMLLVTRIKELPSGLGGGYVNAGSKINTQVVVWEHYKNKMLLKVKSYNAIANDSLPIYKSVKANNLEPIIFAFDIKSQ
ncbi:MAG: DUF5118 domain-containing protein, partial [Polaribacter sp.]|nr:DUF5118 domain-containing protein [Polaribacter sp.]